MTTAALVCSACGIELPENAKFCLECDAAASSLKPAEYKQVTVLFADVVHSMEHRRGRRCGAAARDHGRAGRALSRSGAALWRHGGQVHR